MPASIRERITAQLAVVCGGIGLATGGRVRETATRREEGSYYSIEPENESVIAIGDYADQNQFDISIQIQTRGDVPDKIADAIAVAMHSAIFTDPWLDSMCDRYRRIASNWAFSDADLTAGTLTVKYRFTYLCSVFDLTARPPL